MLFTHELLHARLVRGEPSPLFPYVSSLEAKLTVSYL